jgi:AcrR family transcriptional regulator
MLLNTPMLQGLISKGLAEIRSEPEILRVFYERLIAPRFERMIQMIERAKARGELRPDRADAIVVSLLAGPFFFLILFGDLLPMPLPADGLADQLVDAILYGIAAPAPPPET